jgi:hypothetical protein
MSDRLAGERTDERERLIAAIRVHLNGLVRVGRTRRRQESQHTAENDLLHDFASSLRNSRADRVCSSKNRPRSWNQSFLQVARRRKLELCSMRDRRAL